MIVIERVGTDDLPAILALLERSALLLADF